MAQDGNRMSGSSASRSWGRTSPSTWPITASVSVYNRTTSKMTDFVEDHPPGSFGELGGSGCGQAELEDFVNSIEKPRRIVVMVAAGKGTDAVIESLLPLLDAGDLIVDGGNAHWEDTIRREKELKDKGILFVGTGVSGARRARGSGPSLMPGGNPESWKLLEPIWTSIAAKVDPKTGKPNLDARPATRRPTASPAPPSSARAARGTTSRWSTTASNTATCR